MAYRLLGRSVALWSALLVAISPYNLWYSQEVRMYTLGAVLGILALWCALNVGRNSLAHYAGYVLAAALGLYALYYFAFLLLALNLYIIVYLLHRRQQQPLRNWLLAQAGVLILYLPWLSIAWQIQDHYAAAGSRLARIHPASHRLARSLDRSLPGPIGPGRPNLAHTHLNRRLIHFGAYTPAQQI